MKIMKFGGSSVSTPARIRDVVRIVRSAAERERVIVVVSAFQDVTDRLIECARGAEVGGSGYAALYGDIARRHRSAASALLAGPARRRTRKTIDALLSELHDVLAGVHLLRHCPPRALDAAAGFGERLSAVIISAALGSARSSCFVDARRFVVTDENFTRASVLFDRTQEAARRVFAEIRSPGKRAAVPVVTGFIGATADGQTTTIGRNGSDYTAAIVGAVLGASAIEIWTDVDGIMSADPRTVPASFVIPQMSYEEAMELSYFGAKVLHSASIAPAVAAGIPIRIKNTLNPAAPGTLVSRRAGKWEGVAKGICAVEDLALLTLRGMGMVGVPGTAERLFRALASRRVNVILISQASSEHTICFAVSGADAPEARRAIAHEFRYELQNNFTSLDEKHRQSVVAIIGEGMKGMPGVAGKVFGALGRNNINVAAIAQGASERNISFVIDSSESVRAINVIHEAFFEKRKRLSLVVVGVGNIGRTLLRQLHQQESYLASQNFDVRVCAVADSKRFWVEREGIDLARWADSLRRSPDRMDARVLARRIADLQLVNVALVDCTASREVVDSYADFVKANLHVITPNKEANVLSWDRYSRLMELLRKRQKHFLYEANVGAGLPIISTLKDLISSGDRVVAVEGILSGTLSFLFTTMDDRHPFSAAVREARRLGFTEPDPREDLAGRDVARKLLILARLLGLKMNLSDIRQENLVPPPLRRGRFSPAWLNRLAAADASMQKRIEKARKKGCVLRYVGTLRGTAAAAGVRELPADHPLATVAGTDNLIAFTTARYSKSPLIVRGPGAGADVTAMGVFSDILKLLNYIPS